MLTIPHEHLVHVKNTKVPFEGWLSHLTTMSKRAALQKHFMAHIINNSKSNSEPRGKDVVSRDRKTEIYKKDKGGREGVYNPELDNIKWPGVTSKTLDNGVVRQPLDLGRCLSLTQGVRGRRPGAAPH